MWIFFFSPSAMVLYIGRWREKTTTYDHTSHPFMFKTCPLQVCWLCPLGKSFINDTPSITYEGPMCYLQPFTHSRLQHVHEKAMVCQTSKTHYHRGQTSHHMDKGALYPREILINFYSSIYFLYICIYIFLLRFTLWGVYFSNPL